MNLLVTGSFAWTEIELNNLRMLGHDVVFMQQEKSPLPCDAAWIEGIVGNSIFLHHPIEVFTSLRFVQLTSAGFDRVPMEYIKQHNIKIFNARGVYSIPMAEFAVSGVLQLYKESRFFCDNQKKHKWKKHRGLLELYGKTVCIVGCGSVGSECAKRFDVFGCNVIGVDAAPYESKDYEEMVSLDRFDEALCKSDVVVLTLPLLKNTYHLMNSERFSKMKNGALLVNIARGAIVDTSALITALEDRLGGAILDVFEEEPLGEDSPLWNMENVIVTPHNSFVGEGNGVRLWNVIKSNLEMFE